MEPHRTAPTDITFPPNTTGSVTNYFVKIRVVRELAWLQKMLCSEGRVLPLLQTVWRMLIRVSNRLRLERIPTKGHHNEA